MIYGDVKMSFMNISSHPKIQTLTITFVPRRADGAASIGFAERAIKEILPKVHSAVRRSIRNPFHSLTLTHGRRKLQAYS